MTSLNAGRTARRDLAIWDAVDACWGQQPHSATPEAVGAARTLVDLDRRLRLETVAEHGYLPQTVEGCINVLNTVALIAETLGPMV